MTLCLPAQQKINFPGMRILAPVGRGSGLWVTFLGRLRESAWICVPWWDHCSSCLMIVEWIGRWWSENWNQTSDKWIEACPTVILLTWTPLGGIARPRDVKRMANHPRCDTNCGRWHFVPCCPVWGYKIPLGRFTQLWVPVIKLPDLGLTTHSHPALRFRMGGAIPLPPSCASWCYRETFTFYCPSDDSWLACVD